MITFSDWKRICRQAAADIDHVAPLVSRRKIVDARRLEMYLVCRHFSSSPEPWLRALPRRLGNKKVKTRFLEQEKTPTNGGCMKVERELHTTFPLRDQTLKKSNELKTEEKQLRQFQIT